MTTNKNTIHLFFLSSTFHLILLLSMGFLLHFSSDHISFPHTQPATTIYIQHTTRYQPTVHLKNKSPISHRLTSPSLLKSQPTPLSQSPDAHSFISREHASEKNDALLTLLHTAIQTQQQYPQSALQMEQQGRVTLSFVLFANGQIKNLHLTKSSGIFSLDEAALTAVQHAIPFKQVDQYLKNSREYTIDVVFELA